MNLGTQRTSTSVRARQRPRTGSGTGVVCEAAGSLRTPGFSSRVPEASSEATREPCCSRGVLCVCLSYLTLPMGLPQVLPHCVR